MQDEPRDGLVIDDEATDDSAAGGGATKQFKQARERPAWDLALDQLHRSATAATNRLGMLLMKLRELERLAEGHLVRMTLDISAPVSNGTKREDVSCGAADLGEEATERLRRVVVRQLRSEVWQALRELQEAPAAAMNELPAEAWE